MIPQNWVAYRRAEDNEILGYLTPSDDIDLVVPVTLFGYPLSEPTDKDCASDVLEAIGLAYLAEPWLLTTDQHPEPMKVQIVEASPERVVVKGADYGAMEWFNFSFFLEVPATELAPG
ncbi:MAG: hypothetical protein ABI137_10770 [Antricoccus sp.]